MENTKGEKDVKDESVGYIKDCKRLSERVGTVNRNKGLERERGRGHKRDLDNEKKMWQR